MALSEGSISKRVRLTIRGIVQGVGFRPFVYRQALAFGIGGYVSNTSEGVEIDAEGEALKPFIESLRSSPPPRSRIDSIDIEPLSEHGYREFEIRKSSGSEKNVPIPLDTALCPACEKELRDPSDRRYDYPFINCTDCGPRYTIIQIPPYDRVRTSMKHFAMCDACAAEYADPHSRRYHAEPISFPDCGPRLELVDNKGQPIEGDPIEMAAAMLRDGKIIALKGLGGFHLMCDATRDSAVRELRVRKNRRAKPLAVMFASLEQAREYARITEAEAFIIEGEIKPIVIVEAKEGTDLSKSIAPGIGRLGVFIPYTPLHKLLFERIDFPLVATSANISEEPILVRKEDILHRLGDVIDAVLDHNRGIVNALDDAVVQIAQGHTVMLRMGRGYAPWSRTLESRVSSPLLAVGAHQKSAVAIANGRTLVLGGHIGDLGSVEAEAYFERTVETFRRFYDFIPQRIVHDLHPQYTSTRYALRHQGKKLSLQHHYVHILACMAEYGLREKVLGFAFDGTGYGDDGELWGGEVLTADVHGYERIAALKPIALLGGEKAIKEPRRIALSLLFEHYSLEEVLSLQCPTLEAFLPHEIRQFHYLWQKQLNSPLSTSMGRLFDAVASLGGFVQRLEYEGEGGLLMEHYVDPAMEEPFAFCIENKIIDYSPMIVQILELSQKGEEGKREIASRFIATVAAMVHTLAQSYPDMNVVVAGGVFQNRALMERLYRIFSERAFYAQQRTPINDGSIALGQAWWGIHNP